MSGNQVAGEGKHANCVALWLDGYGPVSFVHKCGEANDDE